MQRVTKEEAAKKLGVDKSYLDQYRYLATWGSSHVPESMWRHEAFTEQEYRFRKDRNATYFIHGVVREISCPE